MSKELFVPENREINKMLVEERKSQEKPEKPPNPVNIDNKRNIKKGTIQALFFIFLFFYLAPPFLKVD